MWCLRRSFVLLTIVIVTQAASGKNVGLSEGLLTSELHSDPSTLHEACTPPNGCSSPFEIVGDQCIFIDVITRETQQESRQVCHSLGGELVAIKTATQLKNIIHNIYARGFQDRDFWIDGSDAEEEENWRFSTGGAVPMATPFWVASEIVHMPDNEFGIEDCAVLLWRYSYLMNDASCNRSLSAICEHNPELKATDSIMEQQPLYIECPPFYVDIWGECLSFLTWEEGTWYDARQSCSSLSGQLASINDIEQLRALYLYVHREGISSHSFWLGGSDAAEEGRWIWIDGEPVPWVPLGGEMEAYLDGIQSPMEV